MKRAFAICAAAALIPVVASAQSGERTSAVPSYHLLQVSVDSAATAPAEFKEKTEAVQSCEEASELARELGADVTRNRFIRASVLPEAVQDVLKDLPTGHATPVFTNGGSVLRVLVLCARQ